VVTGRADKDSIEILKKRVRPAGKTILETIVDGREEVDAGGILDERGDTSDELEEKPVVGLVAGVEAEDAMPSRRMNKILSEPAAEIE
jgi:hypothetical protein